MSCKPDQYFAVMPQWPRPEGVTLSTVGLRREPLAPALWGHTFYVVSLLHGRSDNSKGHVKARRGRTDTSSSRSVPTEYGGFRVEVVRVVGTYIA